MAEQDLSTQSNPFAERLSAALAACPLSLARIRARLAAEGQSVSTATLSYWASGRSLPTRDRSVAVVEELERVLQVPRGSLLDALPGGPVNPGALLAGRDEVLERASEEHGLLLSTHWRLVSIQREILIGPDGAEKRARTTQVMRANAQGLLGWTSVYSGYATPVEVEAQGAVRIRREIALEQDLRAVEFVFDQPIDKGAVVVATTVVHQSGGDVTTVAGFGLARPLDVFTQEVTFEGDIPSTAHRAFTEPGAATASVTAPVLFSGRTAQMALTPASAGMHELVWSW